MHPKSSFRREDGRLKESDTLFYRKQKKEMKRFIRWGFWKQIETMFSTSAFVNQDAFHHVP
jgi:hypothetical protein